ncbi:DivIVA domain-containing protein [Microbacterium immunditiarum]|uniref:Cell division septum initiation protein DivIVA n=1 Tax=Microbacterium immunditiarum TaxID=337480 RepID=A0A7Y9GRV9_9MICO|nr:DivIVA domain-containing protein [Microbacterium immunditiarum]NYE21493.1 cell division septum initiation protein DivIVA [Microbacterium immunditiarum]
MIMTGTQSAPITPELLRGASFSREGDGYSRAEVHSLLAAAADALEVARRDNEALTASLSSEDNEISSRAVLLLSQAQRIADDAVAEAESYSKDLIETARNQYREIVERAQQAAHSIEHGPGARPVAEPSGFADSPGAPAAWTFDQTPGPAFATDDLFAVGPASPDEVVRARQFARMASAQVHSLLESLEREIARLGANAHREQAPEERTPHRRSSFVSNNGQQRPES